MPNNVSPMTVGHSMDSNAGQGAMVTSSFGKFAIGFVAGVALMVVPRAIQYGLAPEASYFSQNYILLVLVLASVLGAVMVIMDYGQPKPPKETFLVALAIPGLLAGSINSAMDATRVNEIKEQADGVIEEQGIRKSKVKLKGALKPVDTSDAGISVTFISAAYAQDANGGGAKKAQGVLGGVVPQGKRDFYIEIEQAPTESAAKASIQARKAAFPRVQAVQADDGTFRIITDSAGMTELEAAAEALRIKKKYGLDPVLLEIES